MQTGLEQPKAITRYDTRSTVTDRKPRRWRFWLWPAILLLAIAAYMSVTWLGFLSDDLVLLNTAKVYALNVQDLLPTQMWPFYRPFGVIATWELGWQLWGFNPLPYHILGLLLHAATSLLLGLWLANITSRRLLGWLAGALFAVFPANVEGVGWIAAQWDLWAAFFGIGSLFLFERWWRARPSWYLYALSLAAFFLGVFSKESLFAFLPIFPLSIWLLYGRMHRAQWRVLLLSMVPFGAVIVLNIGLRVAARTPFGYAGARTDFGDFFWDSLTNYLGMLIAPVNAVFAGKPAEQVVESLTSLALLVGLVLYGRRQWRFLLFGGAWIALSAIPVLNLSLLSSDLQNNRFLYLGSAGYAILIAALLYPPVRWLAAKRPALAWSIVIGPLAAGVLLTWINLQPWHVATAQVSNINAELYNLIPPAKRPQGMVWYVQNLPDNYAGADIFRLGLGNLRYFTSPTADTPEPVLLNPDPKIVNIARVNLNQDARDAFAIRFIWDPTQESSYIDYIAGRTAAEAAPVATDRSSNLHVWDFTQCAPGTIDTWQAQHATATCAQAQGLCLTPQSPDPQIIVPSIDLGQDAGQARFLRLRVSIRYPKNMPPDRFLGQWYWGASADNFSEANQISFPINHTTKTQVYWSFIPVAELPSGDLTLRFDPINSNVPEEIQWIAADLVR